MAKGSTVEAVFTGGPKLISDERGTWTSSIFRDRIEGSVAISLAGLVGDKVAQPYHGGPGAAICVHLADHYAFWNERLFTDLQAGSVGENITLQDITEYQVCVGDYIRLGTALVQVSGPRVPCANLARRIGRSDWVKMTILENRTGFYLRVLEPGVVQAGDTWFLKERLNFKDLYRRSIGVCIWTSIRALLRACWRCRVLRNGGKNRPVKNLILGIRTGHQQ